MSYIIEVKELSKKYQNNEVLKNISLNINDGKIYSLVGLNGSGKSTFINILSGIITEYEGNVRINGEKNWNHNLLGVMPEHTDFYPEMSGLQHIKYMSNLSNKKISIEEINEIADTLDLKRNLKKKVSTYSFGMKKKLGLIQAIVHDPAILLLDEPTSGVDLESTLKIQSLLKKLKSKGKTIIFSSHNLEEIKNISDHVLLVNSGKIDVMDSIENSIISDHPLEVKIVHDFLTKLELKKFRDYFEGENWVEMLQIKSSYSIFKIKKEKIPSLIKVLISLEIKVFQVTYLEDFSLLIRYKDGVV